ncbi:obscurin isoform X1 [Halichoeres trimaculatus]|uniref:obscurin isoform X1 n=1 Tax=Halichoeres trimaculatus TaxID=147232 RepID=UPI003D9EB92B
MFDTSSTTSAWAAQWKMRLIRVFGVIYFSAVCAAQITEDVPPVPSLQLQSSWLEVYPSEKATFRCEINNPSEWNFIWLRDKRQIPDSDPNVSLSADGSVLTITATNLAQSGSYTCKGKHKTKGTTTVESDPRQLSVSQPPPNPTLKRLTQWLDVFEDEIVAFGCEFGNPDWTLTWYKNQKELKVDPFISLDEEGTLLNITSASKAHEGEYACKAQLDSRSVSSGFSNTATVTIYDNIPKPTLRRAPGFDPMFVGETVNFTCSVDVSSGWVYEFQKGEKILPATGKIHSFQLALSDQGKYMCSATRGKDTSTEDSEEMQLNVLEIPVPSLKKEPSWLDVFPEESVQLSCGMDSGSGWTYTWTRDGQKVGPGGVVSFDQSGSTLSIKSATSANKGLYKCKGELKERSVSSIYNTGLSLTVYAEKPRVTLIQEPDYRVMFPGESVTYSCHLNVSSGWEYLWYKDGKELSVSDKKYSVTSVSTTNAGSYSCKAKRGTHQVFLTDQSNVKQLQIQGNRPKPLMTQQPNANNVYVGESVSFKCKVEGSTGWRYLWYKDGAQLSTVGDTLTFTTSFLNKGTYKCSAIRDKTNYPTEHSDTRTLMVSEIPVPSSKKEPSWLDVFPEESVQLSCGMDSGSGWTYTWTRDGQKVGPGGVVSFDQSGSTLSIKSATSANKGLYKCKGELKDRSVSSIYNSGLTLTVYAEKPRVSLIQEPDYRVMFPGESVTYSCHINVSSGWEYLWYKDGKDLSVSDKEYSVTSVSTTNAGSYSCKAKRGTHQVFFTDQSNVKQLQIQGTRPKPLMTQQPNVNNVYVGESVSFKCKVEGSTGWRYLWYKDGAQLSTVGDTLTFTASFSNKGIYKCSAIRDKTNYPTEHSDTRTLMVSEIPVPSLEKVSSWLDVFPEESVKLSCGMNNSSGWTYTWTRDGQKVGPGGVVSFDQSGSTLSIKSATHAHKGLYKCKGELKERSVSSIYNTGLSLTVYAEKPRITLTQEPDYTMYPGERVTYSCHINVSSGWKYLLYKDGKELTKSKKFLFNATKNGSYSCKAQRGTEQVFSTDQSNVKQLQIQERPLASITLLTGWSEVFSAVSLELKCVVEEDNEKWNYTWFKEGQRIENSVSKQHSVTPDNDPDQSHYICQGIRNVRPFYSRKSEQFITKNLLLKRRLLLSISGLIFFGIIAVLIGCIACRVFRKPADDDEGPEEADLFLSMAQQKGAGVPCPLVEFITDSTLNSPSKEGEGNGMICSETEPLPITAQEDQAGTAEGADTAETNGGLVSFKQ